MDFIFIDDMHLQPLDSIKAVSGKRGDHMQGPERMSIVQSEAVCVAGHDEGDRRRSRQRGQRGMIR